jgi:uncharacterized protein with GYD domain
LRADPGADTFAAPRQAREEETMAKYVVLFNWTDQGIRTYQESPARVEAAPREMERFGVRLQSVHWTLGPYDLVAQFEAPDDESLTGALLALGAQGNVRTTTLRAFSREEFERVIGQRSG